jgi:hypothetical protein
MVWTRKTLYKLATGPAYWPPIDTPSAINTNPAEAGSVYLRLNCMWRNIQDL